MFWNSLLTVGSGVGIEIRGQDLEVALVKSRWKGVTVVAKTTVRDFRRRPAAEWGEECQAFLRSHGFRDMAAMLAVPRGEMIVRLLSLPAVSGSELKPAIRFQVDGLHPYGEENVYYSFARLDHRAKRAGNSPAEPHAAASEVAVVIAARSVVDGYADLFAEAGVKLRGVTVAAAGYFGAARLLRRRAPEPFVLADQQESAFEIYGESQARPFFSAVFDSRSTPLGKAVSAAASELRLPEGEGFPLLVCGERTVNSPLSPEEVLGSPLQAPPEFDLARDAPVFVTALGAACPRWGWRINLLPASRRVSSARWPVAATAAAAVSVAVVTLLLWLRGPIQDSRYARELGREVRRLEGVEREVRSLEQQAQKLRARRAQLEGFRRHAESDLALVTEISRQLPKSVSLNSLEIDEEFVQLTGQAESAAPLLGLLDNSGVLTGASFSSSITRNENREVFRIRAARRSGTRAPANLPDAHAPAHKN